MESLFLICAIVGGAILLFQFAMTLFGFGSHEMGFDGLDATHAADALHGDATDALHSGGDASHAGGGDHDVAQHDTSSLFKMLTFRSVVAAVAFFGVAGMAAVKSDLAPWTSLGIAVLAGAAALYFVGWVFQAMHGLSEDGTVRIEQAIGLPGTVYIPIPPQNSGAGKIQLKLQNRIVELRAVTGEADKLPTGASVIVVEVLNANTVEVEMAREPAQA